MTGVKLENLRTIEPISVSELEKMHTGSLLRRLQELRSLQVSYEVSDWIPEERDEVKKAGLIAFTDSDIWRTAFADVKRLLEHRDHAPRGSKEKRQADAFRKKHR